MQIFLDDAVVVVDQGCSLVDPPEQPRFSLFEEEGLRLGEFFRSISLHTDFDQSIQVVNAVLKLHQIELDPKPSERLEVPNVPRQFLHVVPRQVQELQFCQVNDGFDALVGRK